MSQTKHHTLRTLVVLASLCLAPQFVAAQAVAAPKAILLHQVQAGDSLDSILQDTYLPGERPSRGAIVQANPHAFVDGDARRIVSGAVLTLPLASAPRRVLAQQPTTPVVGTVEMLDGKLTAYYDDGQRVLTLGQAVHEEDRLLLDSGRAKIRLFDGSQLYLQDNTDVLLSKLEFKRGDSNIGARLIELGRGGLRMISGVLKPEVTAAHPDIRTPVAVIGLRGTETVLHYCAKTECETRRGALPGGLLTGLADGEITLGNTAGESTLDIGDVFKVADANRAPEPAPEFQCAMLGVGCAPVPRCEVPRQRGGQGLSRKRCR